jgi:hypothetical protein
MTEKGTTQKTPEIGNFARTSEGTTAVADFMQGAKGSVQKMPEKKKGEEKEPEKEEKSLGELNQEMTKLEEDIEKVEAAPELSYEDKLKKHGIPREEAEKIIDALMVGGEYQRTYQITPKYSVTFRTRKLEDQNRALDIIEARSPQYPSTVGNIVSEYNLAASLVNFRDLDFSDKKVAECLEWVRKLPDSVARLLANKLSKFDQMVLDVLDEGAIENF